MSNNRIGLSILLICFLLCVIGCQYIPNQETSNTKDKNIIYGEADSPTDAHTETNAFDELNTEQSVGIQEDLAEVTTDSDKDTTTKEYVTENTEEVTEESSMTGFDVSTIPDFSGEPFYILNNNVPFFNETEKNNKDVFENYSDLDDLGRCGVAYANICIDIMPTEERGEIGQIRPSGWHTVKYNGIVDGNYLYNRCHLIGYQLAGENTNEKNLITGTRYMNIVGMLSFESEVYEYVQETNNHVLYRVTPIFEGNNLVASGVEMEAYSVEDSGKGVCFNAYVYNVQPGIIINYTTGDSEVDPNYSYISTKDNNITGYDDHSSEESTTVMPDCNFVLNTNTKKFHYPSCDSVQDMKEKNKEYYIGDRQTLIDQGYSPCGRCKP